MHPMFKKLPQRPRGTVKANGVDTEKDVPQIRRIKNPFRFFNSSPEVIRVTVMMYIRYPLSPRHVEDILFERAIDICHETVRLWWNRFARCSQPRSASAAFSTGTTRNGAGISPRYLSASTARCFSVARS